MGKLPRAGIKFWLITHAAAAAIPFLLLSAYLIFQFGRNDYADTVREVTQRAQAAAISVGVRLSVAQSSLEFIADTDTRNSRDIAQLYSSAQKLVKNTPAALAISLVAADNSVVFITTRPLNAPRIPASQIGAVRQVFDTGKPFTSGPFKAPGSDRFVVGIGVPIFQAGKVAYCLRLVFPTTAFDDLLKAQNFPSSWTTAIIDGNGVLLARSRTPERYVGELVTEGVRTAIQSGVQGMFDSRTKEGIQSKTFVVRVPHADWHLVIGVPQDDLFEIYRAGLLNLIGYGLVAGFVGLAISLWLARFITRQLRDVVSASADMQRDAELHLEKLVIREFSEVAQHIAAANRRERHTNAARDAARAAANAKGMFLANMSHELRTPMSAVLGLLQLLGNTALTSGQHDYVQKITGAAKSLLGLLNDILDFSKIEAGKLELEVRPFRLDQLMRELAVVLSNNVGNKNVEVLYDLDPALPERLLGDVQRLKQVLINLAGNAIKFTEKGQVVVAVRLDATDLPDAEPAQDGATQTARLHFSVTDSGIGIAPENIPKLFNSFTQAEASTTRKFGGTGLGLAICKLLVEMMGGSIRVESELGVGSQFAFDLRLPLQPDAAGHTVHAAALGAERQRVLLVDDNAVARNLLSQMMRPFGWQIDTADSAQAALAMVPQAASSPDGPYTLVYVDCQLPPMDGWATVQGIASTCAALQIVEPRYVVISSNNRDAVELHDELEQQRLSAFLVKPVTASMLLNAALPKARRTDTLRRTKRTVVRVLEGMRILVVEDNAINQQIAEELLSSLGAKVSIAADGEKGVQAIASHKDRYDIVLMDIHMPVMDGFEATRTIREKLGLRELPIVGLTANAMESDRQDCLNAGMNAHIGKPFDLAQMASVLIRLTGHRAEGDDPPKESNGGSDKAPAEVSPATANDLDLAGALARMGGRSDLYVRAARDLQIALPDFVTQLSDALRDGQSKQATMLLHTLKGNAATLGLTLLAGQAAELEKRCLQHASAAELEPKIQALARCIASALQTLDATQTRLQASAASAASGAAPAEHAAGEQPEVHRVVASLLELLANEDYAALEVFSSNHSVLARLGADIFAQLESALQDLDLEAASVILKNVQA